MAPTNQTGPHQLDVAIGHRIRERRRSMGFSQQRLAEAVGVTFQQIQKYERGSNRVSFSRLLEIAHAMNCSLSDLSDGLDAPSATEAGTLNGLLAVEGAMELLEAYATLPSRDLRRALVLHARTLGGAGARPRLERAS